MEWRPGRRAIKLSANRNFHQNCITIALADSPFLFIIIDLLLIVPRIALYLTKLIKKPNESELNEKNSIIEKQLFKVVNCKT